MSPEEPTRRRSGLPSLLAGGSFGGMPAVVKRTFSMRPDVDRMLVAHVEHTPGATLSSAVNAALVDYLEAAALAAYREWDMAAGPEEREVLVAFSAHDDRYRATE